MASYIIAGKADDPSFARAEYAARQIEAACPNIFFRFEMKHPEMWKEFINTIFRKYDFDGYPEDFAGPLIWTHEGDLVGGSAEFVQKVCIDKFGIAGPPAVTDPMFKHIASDNLKQVKLQQYREQHGPPFAELCEAAHKRVLSAGLLTPACFESQKQRVIGGASMEIWISNSLSVEREELRKTYGNGEPVCISARLAISTTGLDQSFMVLLHPGPLVQKHLVLVPQRLVKETEAEAAADAEATTEPPEKLYEIPANPFRCDTSEDLGLEHFTAAMEVMLSIGGVTTWMGLAGASEYRHPLDTHLQVLPFPVHSAGEESPLRYPLELLAERAAREGEKSLRVFPFLHFFASLGDGAKAGDLAKTALEKYEAFRGRPGPADCVAVAFTTSWLLVMPLDPPAVDSARHEAWLQVPPPPPCALAGLVICPAITPTFPETAELSAKEGGQLVSTRAEEEGIPEGCPEFAAASREVRIATRLTDSPVDIMAVWALPARK